MMLKTNTCPGKTSCFSNFRNHWQNSIISQLNLRKSHSLSHSHSHSHSHSSPASIWKVMIITGNGKGWSCQAFSGMGMLAAAVVLSTPPPSEETLSNIPQTLSGNTCDYSNSSDSQQECEETKVKRIQKPKSRKAETCTSKCVTTCTRGGEGSPGEGPLNLRGPIVVFKPGFRSRQYCLVECSDICNLLDDVDKGR